MEDNTDIAFLAASVEREMKQSLMGSQGLKYNRTDFRRFLNGNPNMQHPANISPTQHHYNNFNHPSYGPPSQQYYPNGPQQYTNDGFSIPEGNLTGPIPQIVAPSRLQLPNNGVQSLDGSSPVYEHHNAGLETGGFNVPNYNASPSSKITLEDEQEFRDALIKEIKSFKKTVNKLNKTNEELKLTVLSLRDKVFELSEKLKIELTPDPIENIVIDEIEHKPQDLH